MMSCDQVVVVGEIMEVSEAPSNVTYKIDDRTGPWIEVKRWMDEQVHVYTCVGV